MRQFLACITARPESGVTFNHYLIVSAYSATIASDDAWLSFKTEVSYQPRLKARVSALTASSQVEDGLKLLRCTEYVELEPGDLPECLKRSNQWQSS